MNKSTIMKLDKYLSYTKKGALFREPPSHQLMFTYFLFVS